MNLDNKKPGRKPLYVYYIIAAVIIILLNVLLLPAIEGRKVQTTDYSTFLTGVEKDYVKTVEIQDDYIYYVAESDGQEGYFRTVKMNDPDLVDRLHDANVKFGAAAPQQTSIWISLIAGYVLPIAIFILLGRWLSKKMMSSMGGGPGGAMSFGKSNAKVYVKSSTGIKFSDVAGEDEAKDLLTEIVDYLHNPQKYREIGASMPKGALLVGPPGTGKTLLAKAVAGEAEVPFFSISGSEFVEMFVGMGAAKVRDLFKQANEKAPCIVFIDEIDTIGKKRDGAGFTGGNDEREQTLNQLLTEMDGFDGSKGVVILAATNRPDSLDPALLRPGRFDRRIPVELPDLKGREEILKVHAKKIKIADSVRFDEIAKAAADTGFKSPASALLILIIFFLKLSVMYSAPVNIIFHDCFRWKLYTVQCPFFIFCKTHTVNNVSHMFLTARRIGINIFLHKFIGIQDNFDDGVFICPDQKIFSQTWIFLSRSSHKCQTIVFFCTSG